MSAPLRVTAWSYSRFKAWSDCPKAMYAKDLAKTVPFVQSPAMARGDKIHRGVEAYLRKEADALPEATHMAKFEHQMAQLREIPDKVIELKWGFTRSWKVTGYHARGKDPVWLRVVLDAGVVYPDNTGEVIDHKTGKIYGENDDQVELFALTTMNYWPTLTDVTTRLWFLDAGVEKIAEFSRAKDHAKLTAKWEDKVRPMLEDTVFAARPNQWCSRCPLARSNGGDCRHG